MPDSSGVAGSFGLSRLRKKKKQACAIGVAFWAVCSRILIAAVSPSPMPEFPRTALHRRGTPKTLAGVHFRRFVPLPAPHACWNDGAIGGTRNDLSPHLLRAKVKIGARQERAFRYD